MTKEKELLKFDDFDSSLMVNSNKSERAFKTIQGKAKPGSIELELLSRGKVEKLEGQELFEYIYVGMAGLMDAKKAKINRVNEAKDAKSKRSR